MNVETDTSNEIIVTRRLVLRPWRFTDLDDMYEYSRVPDLGRMAGWIPPESREDALKTLKIFIDEKKTFAIEYKGHAVGSFGIEEYDEASFPEFADKRCRELGYVLSKDLWGRGFMPEAVDAVVRLLFEEKVLDVIFATHFAWNGQSARVQEKCGFKRYAVKKCRTDYGTVEDDVVNILTREEWESKYKV